MFIILYLVFFDWTVSINRLFSQTDILITDNSFDSLFLAARTDGIGIKELILYYIYIILYYTLLTYAR